MKVLIAIDSSPCSQRVLDEASARPWPLDTNFFVLNVVDVQRFARFPAMIDDARREATELVNSAAPSSFMQDTRHSPKSGWDFRGR
jgi:hypothetical protein